MYITLSQAKKQLQIDEDFSDDDNYIISLIQVAEDAIAKNLDMPLQEILVGVHCPRPLFSLFCCLWLTCTLTASLWHTHQP